MDINEDTQSDNVNVVSICNAANTIAKAAVTLAVADGTMPDVPDADCDYVLELLKMMLVRKSLSAGNIGNLYADSSTIGPLSRYVDVYKTGIEANHHQIFFYHMLSALSDPALYMTSNVTALKLDSKLTDKCKDYKTVSSARTGTYGYSDTDYNASLTWNQIIASNPDEDLVNCFTSPVSWYGSFASLPHPLRLHLPTMPVCAVFENGTCTN